MYSLWYYPRHKMVHHQIHVPVSGQNLRDLLSAGLQCFETYPCYKWLSDDRGNAALTPEDIEWGAKIWRPRVIAAGWQYWGLVFGKAALAVTPVKTLVAEYREIGLTARIFSDLDEAFQWLVSK